MEKTVFDLFKITPSIKQQQSVPEKINIQLTKDENLYSIEIVNSKYQPLEFTPSLYTGKTRQLLHLIEQIKEKKSTIINWEDNANQIYLAEHDYLIPLLTDMENVIDQDGNPIQYSSQKGELNLEISENTNSISCQPIFCHKGNQYSNFDILSRNYVLYDNFIYIIPELAENFEVLPLFTTKIFSNQLEPFLSLFFSNFSNIQLKMENFRINHSEAVTARPTLIIREIDSNHCLHIIIKSTVPDFPDDFLIEYDVTKIVAIDTLEKKINIQDLLTIDQGWQIKQFAKTLNKIRSSAKISKDAGIYQHDNLFIIDKQVAIELVYNHLQDLLEHYIVYGVEKLKHYNVKHVEPSLKLSLSHGIDFLEGSAKIEIEGQLFSLQDVFRQMKKNSYINLENGFHGIVSKSYLDKLARIFQVKNDKVQVSFFDLPLVEDLINQKTAEQYFPQARSIFKGINSIQKNLPELPKINGKLRAYQEYGYGWLSYLYAHKLGGCLADDMGLGKTLQIIALLAAKKNPVNKEKNGQPVLIIMPTTLLQNWAVEIQKFAPQLRFSIYHGPDRDPSCFSQYPIILSSYGTVRNDIQKIREISFDSVILDESQNIKNMKSQISKAIMLLTANHRFAISGTPVENNIMELYSLFRFLNPSMFSSNSSFIKQYAVPIQKNNDKKVIQELQRKIYPFVLRRTKKEVLKDLPDKVEQILYVEMGQELLEFYEQRRKMYYNDIHNKLSSGGLNKNRFFILQALSELRQLSSVPERQTDGQLRSPKIEVLVEQLADVVSNNHKALVFVTYLDAISLISERLESEGINYLTMSGATKNRAQLVNQFQNDDEVNVFIMTLKTGGVGLNLTAADYVFIFNPWWNKAAENQAIDRIHRIGQKNKVFSYKLITKGTIEEKILELQNKKSDLVASLLKSDGEALKTLNEEDIDFIFRN